MAQTPAVTVAIPARDAETTIERAVRSALDQKVRSIEVLVLDDGSRDGTRALLDGIEDPRLRVLGDGTSRGVAYARLRLLDEARGGWVAWLDADDVAHPDRLGAQLGRVRDLPDVVLCGTWTRTVWRDGRLDVQRWSTDSDALRCMSFFGNPLSTSSVMQRRDRSVGELQPLAEDYDMWLQLLSGGSATVVPRVLVSRHDLPTGAGSAREAEVAACVGRLRSRVLAGLGLPHGVEDVRLLSLLAEPFVSETIAKAWSPLIALVDAAVETNDAVGIYPRGMFASVAYGKLSRALRAGSRSSFAPAASHSDVTRATQRGRRWLLRRTVEQHTPERIAGWFL